MKQKKISIITPTFNQEDFIEETILSVLNQNYENFEHIIIDGKSTDSTLKIVEKYKHLKWISEEDSGQTEAINKGFKMASGEILTWINSDDYFEENIFPLINSAFEDINCNVIYGDITFVDEKSNKIKKITGEVLELRTLSQNPDLMRQPGTFWRKSLLDQVGILNQNLHLVMDLDLFVRMLKITDFKYIPQNLSYYREYENTKTMLMLRHQVIEIYKVFFKHKIKIPFLTHKKLLGRYLNTYKAFKSIKDIVFPKGILTSEKKHFDS